MYSLYDFSSLSDASLRRCHDVIAASRETSDNTNLLSYPQLKDIAQLYISEYPELWWQELEVDCLFEIARRWQEML